MRTRFGTRWLHLLPLGALAAAAACRDATVAPRLGPTDAPARVLTGAITDEYTLGTPVHGAIFTTTPDGGVVNANTKYTQKIEVYLDGGPRNANAQAAGLPDGLYVFQITDPAGKLLLSKDPARCRVVQVDGGVIQGTVAVASIPGNSANEPDVWGVSGGNRNNPCHVEDGPEGAAGASGQHDTNSDTELGGGKTVQMMPFLDTPNPGGVYKAWITPLKSYIAKGGDLNNQTAAVYSSSPRTLIGYQPDPGFKNPSRNFVKTDNFKVVDNPPFVRISKVVDGKPYAGWPVTVYELVDGAWIGKGWLGTTATFAVPLGADVRLLACEAVLPGYKFVSATVGGVSVTPVSGGTPPVPTDDGGEPPLPVVCVNVPAFTSGTTIDVEFVNRTVKPEAKISITPANGINEVEDEHTFTGTVQVDPDETGFRPAPDGTEITFTTTGSGTFVPASGKCLTVNGTGACSVVLKNPSVGLDVVTATATALGLTRSTDGVAPNSPPGNKYWVDAYIAIAPNATNGITEDHTFTATYTAVPGTIPAPYTVTFDELRITVTPPAGFVKGTDYTESTTCAAPPALPSASGNVATCTTTINSNKATAAGSPFTANATGKVTFSKTFSDGLRSDQIERTTDGAYTTALVANPRYRNSGPATKAYVAGSLEWRKIDASTAKRLVPGATFRVRRTSDRSGAPVSTPDFTVTDGQAPDVGPSDGLFRVIGLPLGTYCVRETAAPAGYLADPTERCGSVTLPDLVLTLDDPNGSAGDFVNSINGRMTGGSGKVYLVELDQYLTSGFTIHCDVKLSNNLEINWPGNKWHLDKESLTSVLCSDEPNVDPGQPDAPFDTFRATAVGTLNGRAGSWIQFVFQDGGEPGKRSDKVQLVIWPGAIGQGTPALSIGTLTAIRGNIQAHEDQPHR